MPIDGYKKTNKSMSVYDFLCLAAQKKKLTKEEFTRIRNFGTPEELEKAVEQMAAQGGYENLV